MSDTTLSNNGIPGRAARSTIRAGQFLAHALLFIIYSPPGIFILGAIAGNSPGSSGDINPLAGSRGESPVAVPNPQKLEQFADTVCKF